jgi:hypothetical protein
MNKFIHQSTVIYLALIILLRMMAMPLSLIDYSLNKSFISSHLCQNRLKPQMHCGGTCYLNKQLTKANDSQESRDQKGSIKNLIIDFFEPLNKPCFDFSAVRSGYSGAYQSGHLTSKFISNIFHPPIA